MCGRGGLGAQRLRATRRWHAAASLAAYASSRAPAAQGVEEGGRGCGRAFVCACCAPLRSSSSSSSSCTSASSSSHRREHERGHSSSGGVVRGSSAWCSCCASLASPRPVCGGGAASVSRYGRQQQGEAPQEARAGEQGAGCACARRARLVGHRSTGISVISLPSPVISLSQTIFCSLSLSFRSPACDVGELRLASCRRF